MKMDCSRFEHLLDSLLGGGLTKQEESDAREHTMQCARCRELLEIARGDLDILPGDVQEGLTASILESTSGSTCNRVESVLCDYVDSNLGEEQSELVSLHIDHCDRCSALAAVLSAISVDLSAMAEIEPDENFVQDVMTATVYRPTLWMKLNDRFSLWWSKQIRRPRFAIELAYTGAVILFLVFGAPNAPLRGVSPKVVDIAQSNPAEAVVELWENNRDAPGAVAEFGRTAWGNTGTPLANKSKGVWFWVVDKEERLGACLGVFGRSVKVIAGDLWNGDWFVAWEKWGVMNESLVRTWRDPKGAESKLNKETEP